MQMNKKRETLNGYKTTEIQQKHNEADSDTKFCKIIG